MSDLADLIADVAKDLPAQVRKVLDTALANGWELNRPGMTLALRLNHPTDDLAMPVYVTWVVGRTATGRLSFRFDSCGTKGLHSLKGSDLLEYLADPTTVYPMPEDDEKPASDLEDAPPWDTSQDETQNVSAQLGATVIEDRAAPKPLGVPNLAADLKASLVKAGLKPPARPLRVSIPSPR